MNRVLAVIALAGLVGFLAPLAIEVPSPDLLAVIALTILLAGYDFLTSSKNSKD